ncbi:MAG: hypothetical protein KAR38_11385 [Calditrichia bacterium]|nr:hypothetical protein [Calditrichia bacterium]
MIDEKRWQRLSFYHQMGNIASELSRAINFKKKKDVKHMDASLWRLLELVDLTIEDEKNKRKLKELCRFKEVLSDWYCQTNVYNVNPESLKNYSMNFAMLAGKMK